MRDLLARAGAAPTRRPRSSTPLQKGGRYNRSELNRFEADDHDTLLALDLDGEPLHPDHGYPFG